MRSRPGKYQNAVATRYNAKRIESIVAYELKRQVQLLEFLEVKIREQRYENRKSTDMTILRKQTETNIEILKAEKVRQYEAYAEGVTSREEYIRKKDEIADRLARLEKTLKRAEEAETEQNQIFGDIQTVTNKAQKLCEQKKKDKLLTREIVQAMIDTVVIHDEQTVEIRFTFDDVARRAVEYTKEHEIELKDCAV